MCFQFQDDLQVHQVGMAILHSLHVTYICYMYLSHLLNGSSINISETLLSLQLTECTRERVETDDIESDLLVG